MHREIVLSCVLLAMAAIFTVASPVVDAAPYTDLSEIYRQYKYARQNGYWNQLEDEDDTEMLLDIIARLGHIMRNQGLLNTKRGFDLGVTRGHSGSETSKMQMGLEVANYPGGPGRRRRSEQS